MYHIGCSDRFDTFVYGIQTGFSRIFEYSFNFTFNFSELGILVFCEYVSFMTILKSADFYSAKIISSSALNNILILSTQGMFKYTSLSNSLIITIIYTFIRILIVFSSKFRNFHLNEDGVCEMR